VVEIVVKAVRETAAESPPARLIATFQTALFVLFAALLLLKAYTTLQWRMAQDTPLLHYAAFLMDKHHFVPYRDIFETSMPGTLAFHYLIGTLFGYGDAAFRALDLTLLAALLVATFAFMRRFGRLAAAWSALLFGLVYLAQGQAMSLQRDYVGVIPIALALLCIPQRSATPVRLWRFILMGLLFGLSALIKPHLVIAIPIVFATVLAFRRRSQPASTRDFIRCAAATGVSLLVPSAIALAWLAAHSALGAFVDMCVHYLPLHSALTGDHRTISGLARVLYLIANTSTLGGFGALFLCSLLAYYHVADIADGDPTTSISLRCLGLCTLAYAVYPALAGKFWSYHYMPFAYFCSLSAALCLYAWPRSNTSLTRAWILLTALVTTVTVQLPMSDYVRSLASDLRSGPEAHAPKGGRVDEIAEFLKANLHPGDTVQPLDWTGGSIHGMLLAEARLATRFMYDYHFYHHVSSPYIQGLRQSFLSQLRMASPRFIIDVETFKPWVSGPDTTHEFPELRRFLEDSYDVVFEGNGYFIYERRSGTPP
jgi:hypothetical protein